ncbi:hypothetical protein ILUMI_21353 [Ignelater luminosus]|uniref:SCP domain-containing protein n=1 Tax=Ignelater luminosus TaxID=2038154 RepID=A0A8K0FY08_IGNLU|nr:hypothetical protein ILUMI_21353 [Ignelater luminosus]
MLKMYIYRFISIKTLYLIIFYFSKLIFCKNIDLSDLKNILTRKSSKSWLDNWNTTNSNNPYCHLCCINIVAETIGKHCGSHTLCKYPTNHTGPACKGYIQIGFSKAERDVILDAHNTLRNIVASGLEKRGSLGPQPQAANMRILEWNNELANIAERWAAQCIYSHDICRDLERFPVGQNIAHGNLATNNELSFIKTWYDEVQYFNKSEVEHFKLPSQGNHISSGYTQLIWADTYQIGCARAIFQRLSDAQVNYREHFICNYGPSGNIPNQPVYVIGLPCSACQEGTSCTLDYPSLCGGESINRRDEQIESDEGIKLKEVKKLKKPKIQQIKSGQNLLHAYFMLLFSFTIIYVFY